jgi:hypothetical protein
MKQIVHLFVFDTLADWETGYAIAGINNSDAQANPGRYQIKTVGLRGCLRSIEFNSEMVEKQQEL